MGAETAAGLALSTALNYGNAQKAKRDKEDIDMRQNALDTKKRIADYQGIKDTRDAERNRKKVMQTKATGITNISLAQKDISPFGSLDLDKKVLG